MGDGDGTAVFDLFFETGYDGTVAAQHVAEAGGDEAGMPFHLAFADGPTEALDVDFSQPLGGSHDIGGIDGFVGRDHDHLLGSVFYRHVGNLARTDDVDENGFAGVFLHRGTCL